MVACWIRRLHLIQSLASAWGWAKLSAVHLTTISFFSLPFPLRLIGWHWKRPRDSSSLWWSIRLYSHLSDQAFFCALLHSWRSRCRKYEADVWSLSSLQFGSAFGALLVRFHDSHACRRKDEGMKQSLLTLFLWWVFCLSRIGFNCAIAAVVNVILAWICLGWCLHQGIRIVSRSIVADYWL